MLRLAAMVSLSLLCGCATLFASGPQYVTFTSNLEGAEILLDGRPVGRTPATVQVERRAFGQRIVTLRAEGYQTRQFQMQKSLNPVSILNLSSLLSWATDATSGALITYEPNAYYTELAPAGQPRRPPPGPYSNRGFDERPALFFTLINHRRLREQIARSGGDHLETLGSLLGLDAAGRVELAAALAEQAPALVGQPYPTRLFRSIVAIARARGLMQS